MKSSMAVAAVTLVLALGGCGRKAEEQASNAAPASAPAADAPTVFGVMNAAIIPGSNKIWELAGNLYDDKGNLDARLLTDAQWTEIKDAAAGISASSKTIASTAGLKVGPPGTKIQSEGTPGSLGAAEVQAAMDADPKAFSEHATRLVAIADEIATAAAAHDAAKTDDAQSRMTEVCGACHQKFWYPNQPAK
jgi:cytochrome c556